MAVRVTQSYVSVLRPKSGSVPFDVSDSLGFTDEAFLVTIFFQLTDTMLTELSEHNYIQIDVTQTMLSDGVGLNAFVDCHQYLGFTPRVFGQCINEFELDDRTNDVYDSDPITQTIGWADFVIQAHRVTDSLNLSVTVFASREFSLTDLLGLTQDTDTSESEYGREGTDRCIKQQLSFRVTGGPQCVEKSYSPFVADGDDGYDEIPTEAPVLTTGTLTLSYPVVTPTTTLVLKNPTFGNSDTLHLSVVNRETRGGTRILFGDPKWAKAQTLQFTIEHVCTPDFESLLAFLNETLGKSIKLADWEGNDWEGVILTPNTEVVKLVSGYKVAFLFQGEKA